MATIVALTLTRLSPEIDPHYKDLIEGIALEEGCRVGKIVLSPDRVHVEILAGSGEGRTTLTPVFERLTTRMESAIMSKPTPPVSSQMTVHNYGQAGAIGQNATASHNSFQQVASDPASTAQVLELFEKFQSDVRKSDAPTEALDAVMQAKLEAKAGRFDKALDFLGAQAKALVPVAGKAAFKMLTDSLRQHLGLPPTP